MADNYEDMKNSVWYRSFLATRGISENDISEENKNAILEQFNDFVLEKESDPLASVSEDENEQVSQEIADRLEQIQGMEHFHEGYSVNEELDETAYYCAMRSLACSKEEITPQNLQKHIAAESNRIATEYYTGLYAASFTENAWKEIGDETKTNLIIKIDSLVRENKSEKEIFEELKFSPDSKAKDEVSRITAYSNMQPVKKWLDGLKKFGPAADKMLDKIQDFEKRHPYASIAAGFAMGASGMGIAYSAYRAGMAARTLYKQAKAENLSLRDLVKPENRDKLLNASAAVARIFPGGRVVGMALAVQKVFKKQHQQQIVNSGKEVKNSIQEIVKSKGRSGWKNFFKSNKNMLMLTAGTVAAAYAVYKGIDGMDTAPATDLTEVDAVTGASVVESPVAEQAVAENTAPTAENTVPEQALDENTASEQALDENTASEQDSTENTAPEQDSAENTAPEQDSAENTANEIPQIDVNNLTPDQQHDLDMLFKRNPALANEMINDGKWHSSAQLAKMWENDQIDDKMKLQLVTKADELFNDDGTYKDAAMEAKAQQEWAEYQAHQAQQAEAASEPAGETDKPSAQSDNNKPQVSDNDKVSGNDKVAEQIQSTIDFEDITVTAEKQPETLPIEEIQNEEATDVKVNKIDFDKDKITGRVDGHRVTAEDKDIEFKIHELDADNVKYLKNGNIRVKFENGTTAELTSEGKLAYVATKSGVYTQEQLNFTNTNIDKFGDKTFANHYKELMEVREKAAQSLQNETNPDKVQEAPTATEAQEKSPGQTSNIAEKIDNLKKRLSAEEQTSTQDTSSSRTVSPRPYVAADKSR